jgi:hypothetical protein
MDKHTANSAIAAIGIDLAKTVFQLHGIDVAGKVVLRRSMRRRELLGGNSGESALICRSSNVI